MASQSRNIINKYALWEISGGNTTKFWEEEWQQRDKMVSIQALQNIYQKAVRGELDYVKEYWKEGETYGIWRKWRKPEEWDENVDQEHRRIYVKEMESRKIKSRPGLSILRWGKSIRGTLTVKEAYNLTTQQEREGETFDLETIWNNKWWLKVAIFAFLVGKERILTWDKLQKKASQDHRDAAYANMGLRPRNIF